MSNIDRQRIAAVRAMEGLGYTFDGTGWIAPAGDPSPAHLAEADAMHAVLVLRADALDGSPNNSEEGREFAMIAEVSRPTRRYAGQTAGCPAARAERSQCAISTRSTRSAMR